MNIDKVARSVGLKLIDYHGVAAWEAPTCGRLLVVQDKTKLGIVGTRQAIDMADPRNEPYLRKFFAEAAVAAWPVTNLPGDDDIRTELAGILDRCLGRRPLYTFDEPGDVRA